MPFARLRCRLQFLPLGLLWGVIASGFHTYHLLFVLDYPLADHELKDSWPLIRLVLMMMAGTCPIATLLGYALLKRELSPIRWIVNWVITGVASVMGGVAIFWLGFALWMSTQELPPAWSNPIYAVGIFLILLWLGASLYFGVVIAIESAVVAILSAPVSLLVRWLILRRTRVTESAGNTSQGHP